MGYDESRGENEEKTLPIGVDNFREIIKKGYYYIEKAAFIKELLDMKEKSICLRCLEDLEKR